MRTDEFAGLEFDWVAADFSGRLAVFCSAGYGPVPSTALRSTDDQELLLESIGTQTTNPRHSDLLTSPADCPIYCFDWKLCEGPYHLKQAPEPDAGLRIDAIPEALLNSVTRLNLSFTGRKSISAEELREA